MLPSIHASCFQLAQVNIARARGEMTDPVMAEFVSRLSLAAPYGPDGRPAPREAAAPGDACPAI